MGWRDTAPESARPTQTLSDTGHVAMVTPGDFSILSFFLPQFLFIRMMPRGSRLIQTQTLRRVLGYSKYSVSLVLLQTHQAKQKRTGSAEVERMKG